MMQSIEIMPGLYERYPQSNLVIKEQHDNYVAHSLNSALFGSPGYAQAIVNYGSQHLYNYNDQGNHIWTIETQRQPGEVALYHIAANGTPGIFTTTMLSIGLGLAGVITLTWSRYVLIRLKLASLPWLHRTILGYGIRKYEEKFPKIAPHLHHYIADAGHPIRQLLNKMDI